jgi:hypothetical protein
MNPDGQGILARMDATDEAISLAWGEAISIAFRSHRKAGVPIASWDPETHRVVLIPPDEVAFPGEDRPGPVTSNAKV